MGADELPSGSRSRTSAWKSTLHTDRPSDRRADASAATSRVSEESSSQTPQAWRRRLAYQRHYGMLSSVKKKKASKAAGGRLWTAPVWGYSWQWAIGTTAMVCLLPMLLPLFIATITIRAIRCQTLPPETLSADRYSV